MSHTGVDASHVRAWRPRARVQRLRASHSYRIVLLLVIALFLFVAFAPGENWSRSVIVLIECALLMAALWTSGLWQDRRAAVVLAGVGVAAAIAELVTAGDKAAGLVALLQVLLLVATVVVIAVGVLDQRDINAQSVLGAISIYVLLGMFFVFVYSAAALLDSGPFFAQGTDGTLSTRHYFSYVTLATLGYGDYTPAGAFGRTAAVTEALLGQLYLVTVVALLVGRLTRKRAEG